jgi:hypothetical protein
MPQSLFSLIHSFILSFCPIFQEKFLFVYFLTTLPLSHSCLNRVTRLGEFLHIGLLLTLGSLLKIAQVVCIQLQAALFYGKRYAFIGSKNGFIQFGRYFQKLILSPCARISFLFSAWIFFEEKGKHRNLN